MSLFIWTPAIINWMSYLKGEIESRIILDSQVVSSLNLKYHYKTLFIKLCSYSCIKIAMDKHS